VLIANAAKKDPGRARASRPIFAGMRVLVSMPPPGGIAGIAARFLGISATIAYVVISNPAIEAASCNAVRTTLPAATQPHRLAESPPRPRPWWRALSSTRSMRSFTCISVAPPTREVSQPRLRVEAACFVSVLDSARGVLRRPRSTAAAQTRRSGRES